MQSAGWGHLSGNWSQEAPFGFYNPTGIFLKNRKRQYFKMCFPQHEVNFFRFLRFIGVFQMQAASRHAVLADGLSTLGVFFLTLETKQAGSHEGSFLNIFSIAAVS